MLFNELVHLRKITYASNFYWIMQEKNALYKMLIRYQTAFVKFVKSNLTMDHLVFRFATRGQCI